MKTGNLFESERTVLRQAIDLTVASLCAYAKRYRHWAIAFSGGKDSSAVVTLVAHLIETGAIPSPASLTVLYADTRMELTPLQCSAMAILAELEDRGIKTKVVLPAMDDRFFVYMLGRGVPPPNNKTLRWCTSQIKIEPMHAALKELRDSIGEKLLMLTGVRLGESAARDERIVTSCSRDNAECGQGWLQIHTPEAICDTLAPIIHWRVCHVWIRSHPVERASKPVRLVVSFMLDQIWSESRLAAELAPGGHVSGARRCNASAGPLILALVSDFIREPQLLIELQIVLVVIMCRGMHVGPALKGHFAHSERYRGVVDNPDILEDFGHRRHADAVPEILVNWVRFEGEHSGNLRIIHGS